MDKALAIKGVLEERNALRQPMGVSSPTYISEHMQLLAQYTSALDECLAEEQKRVDVLEGELFEKYTKLDKKSVNAAQKIIKYELAADKAEITRLQRLCITRWRLIGSSQSRFKHLIAEATNQI